MTRAPWAVRAMKVDLVFIIFFVVCAVWCMSKNRPQKVVADGGPFFVLSALLFRIVYDGRPRKGTGNIGIKKRWRKWLLVDFPRFLAPTHPLYPFPFGSISFLSLLSPVVEITCCCCVAKRATLKINEHEKQWTVREHNTNKNRWLRTTCLMVHQRNFFLITPSPPPSYFQNVFVFESIFAGYK
jgi:hypothetical protein